MTDDLGPLPKADRQDTLQQLSLKAFRNRLPEETFLFRDERVDDKGVDGSLEIKAKGSFTNCRAQIQLKGTDDGPDKFNNDGSYSLSISTSNLNYLLNGSSPIYVLWLAKTAEIRFAWAQDEWHRLDEDNPNWMNQGSFTVRFREVLTAAELDSIRDRIVRKARLNRRIHETLARNAPAERVVVSIDAETLGSTDPKELRDRLLNGGMTLVSSGYGKQVLEWFNLLNPQAAQEPRIQLVAAFAEFSLGRHHAALGHLGQAVIGRTHLSADDRLFMERVRGACDFHTGKLTLDEYVKKEEKWAGQLSGIQAAGHRLEVTRQTRLHERDLERRMALLQQMRETAGQIVADESAFPAQKLHARLLLLAAESDDIIAQVIESTGQINIRQEAGLPTAGMASQMMEDLEPRWVEWKRQSRQLRDEAIELKHPLLVADSMADRVTAFACVFGIRRLNSVLRGRDEMPLRALIDELIVEAEKAIEVYRTAGSVQGEFRVRLQVADLHELVGDSGKAKAMAEEILPVAEAMDYGFLAARARQLVEGDTYIRRYAALVAERKPQTLDVLLASETDERMRSMAKTWLASVRAPRDRIGMTEKESFTMRQIARERVNWCRHLDLISDDRPLQSPTTAFREEPERFCKCRRLGHQSSEVRRDPNVVIADLKRTFCSVCREREPWVAEG
jgi:hypothetical protein